MISIFKTFIVTLLARYKYTLLIAIGAIIATVVALAYHQYTSAQKKIEELTEKVQELEKSKALAEVKEGSSQITSEAITTIGNAKTQSDVKAREIADSVEKAVDKVLKERDAKPADSQEAQREAKRQITEIRIKSLIQSYCEFSSRTDDNKQQWDERCKTTP